MEKNRNEKLQNNAISLLPQFNFALFYPPAVLYASFKLERIKPVFKKVTYIFMKIAAN